MIRAGAMCLVVVGGEVAVAQFLSNYNLLDFPCATPPDALKGALCTVAVCVDRNPNDLLAPRR